MTVSDGGHVCVADCGSVVHVDIRAVPAGFAELGRGDQVEHFTAYYHLRGWTVLAVETAPARTFGDTRVAHVMIMMQD